MGDKEQPKGLWAEQPWIGLPLQPTFTSRARALSLSLSLSATTGRRRRRRRPASGAGGLRWTLRPRRASARFSRSHHFPSLPDVLNRAPKT